MKAIKKHICGADRVLCYSLRVMRGVSERFGNGGVREKLSGDNPVETMDAAIWLLSALMDAGKRYADNNGIDCPPAPSEDELLDNYDMNDLLEIQNVISETMAASTEQDIKAELKNE